MKNRLFRVFTLLFAELMKKGRTASPLFLFGSGPGSEKVGGLMHNTEIFTVMKAALRLK